MRFRHPDGSTIHLAYCTNVHAAEDVDGIVGQLGRFAAPVRERLGVPRLGVGLWLAAASAARLADDAVGRKRFREELERLGLEVVTLNGFPYRAFHAPVVKRDVYRPDWTEPARAAFTLHLAEVLADLLPDDAVEGSISTLPLAWREGWDAARGQRARAALERVAGALGDLEARTGRRIRVGLEPEPGCVVETTEQAMEALDGLPSEHLGVCLDTCHLAVQFEEPSGALAAVRDAGRVVAKAQLACALRVPQPSLAREALAEFVEPRFLHQTRARTPEGIAGVDDLPAALTGGLPPNAEWRVHFHTAVHAEAEEPLATSQDVLVAALDGLVGGAHPVTRHLEVETYTWTVLPRPPSGDDELVEGLTGELAWARDRLVELGLEEER